MQIVSRARRQAILRESVFHTRLRKICVANTAIGRIGELKNRVTIAKGIHLFPYRTQKLSPSALKILGGQLPGKIRRRSFLWPLGQAVKTPPFPGGNGGSIPPGVTKIPADSLRIGRNYP